MGRIKRTSGLKQHFSHGAQLHGCSKYTELRESSQVLPGLCMLPSNRNIDGCHFLKDGKDKASRSRSRLFVFFCFFVFFNVIIIIFFFSILN